MTYYIFKSKSHNMVEYFQTIRRLLPMKMFDCVWTFFGVGAYRVKLLLRIRNQLLMWMWMSLRFSSVQIISNNK